MKKFLSVISALVISAFCFAQENYWKFESDRPALKRNATPLIVPKIYRTLSLSFDQYKTFLQTAPVESISNPAGGLEISLPYPDNSFKKFRIFESRMMDEALAAEFPQIKTYSGQGVDDPTATVEVDYTSQGFHAYVRSAAGLLFIDPYEKANNNLYITYFSKDYINPGKAKFKCKFDDFVNRGTGSVTTNEPLAGRCIGSTLRTYRIAISCTGEYAVAVCPAGNITKANTLSAIVTTMSRVNGIYQTELGIRMNLIGGNAAIIYTDPDTDPYSGNTDETTLIDESQHLIDSVTGNSNYDIGHIFSTGGGGLASLSVVCKSGSKAMGVSGLAEPLGDGYDVDYVAHEIGHQFSATHTFESETSQCGNGNREKSSAYEPGSATTIMGYANICGSDDIQDHSDPYFHTKSFDQIVAYSQTGTGNTCAIIDSTGNHAPVVVMPVSGKKIPKETPFTLTGTASDVDGDAITYSWEEWDLSNLNSGSEWDEGANSETAPLFKARVPKTTGSRTFPDISVILAGYPSNPSPAVGGLKGETLPAVARDIKFRLVARDNRVTGGGVATGGNGCSSTATFKVEVTDDGPFVLTSPNSGELWVGGSTQEVTWEVANTNDATGINARNVEILMSTNGGVTFPTIVKSSTANDGLDSIIVPNIATNDSVRFMVRATGNIFFDISDGDFTITHNLVLPVSFLQFSALPNGNSISLLWSATTESNINGFEVLRSEGNNNNFVKIGFVNGLNNGGSTQNYSFKDNTAKEGTVYFYRLRQVDLNNAFVYSEIKRAKISAGKLFMAEVMPQPFFSNALIYLSGIEKKDFQIFVRDVMGRLIIEKKIANNEESRLIPVDFNKQASGLYFIKIVQDHIEKTIKAVKH